MDFFKFAEIVFNFIIGQRYKIGEKSQEISVEILNQVRQVLVLIMITLGALTLFCIGMGYLIERVLNKLDEGTLVFTPSLGVILAFLLLCVFTLLYSTNKSIWLKIFKKEKISKNENSNGPLGGQIESVLSLLVLDFIKEREFKREQAGAKKSE